MICRNCGNNFEGNFCPECGTKALEDDKNIIQSHRIKKKTNYNSDFGLWCWSIGSIIAGLLGIAITHKLLSIILIALGIVLCPVVMSRLPVHLRKAKWIIRILIIVLAISLAASTDSDVNQDNKREDMVEKNTIESTGSEISINSDDDINNEWYQKHSYYLSEGPDIIARIIDQNDGHILLYFGDTYSTICVSEYTIDETNGYYIYYSDDVTAGDGAYIKYDPITGNIYIFMSMADNDYASSFDMLFFPISESDAQRIIASHDDYTMTDNDYTSLSNDGSGTWLYLVPRTDNYFSIVTIYRANDNEVIYEAHSVANANAHFYSSSTHSGEAKWGYNKDWNVTLDPVRYAQGVAVIDVGIVDIYADGHRHVLVDNPGTADQQLYFERRDDTAKMVYVGETYDDAIDYLNHAYGYPVVQSNGQYAPPDRAEYNRNDYWWIDYKHFSSDDGELINVYPSFINGNTRVLNINNPSKDTGGTYIDNAYNINGVYEYTDTIDVKQADGTTRSSDSFKYDCNTNQILLNGKKYYRFSGSDDDFHFQWEMHNKL